MGRNVRFDQGADRRGTHPGGDFPHAFRVGIPLHPAAGAPPAPGGKPARRGGVRRGGRLRRIALFPAGERRAGVRPRRRTSRCWSARRPSGRPSRPDAPTAANARRGVRPPEPRWRRLAWRWWCSTDVSCCTFADGRPAGTGRRAVVDGLFAGHQTAGGALSGVIHRPEGLLLRHGDDPAGLRIPPVRRDRGSCSRAPSYGPTCCSWASWPRDSATPSGTP